MSARSIQPYSIQSLFATGISGIRIRGPQFRDREEIVGFRYRLIGLETAGLRPHCVKRTMPACPPAGIASRWQPEMGPGFGAPNRPSSCLRWPRPGGQRGGSGFSRRRHSGSAVDASARPGEADDSRAQAARNRGSRTHRELELERDVVERQKREIQELLRQVGGSAPASKASFWPT